MEGWKMKNSRFSIIDTNVLVRVITNDVARQAEKARELLLSNEKIFFVPEIVIFECLYILQGERYGIPRKKAIEAIRKVLSLPRIDYDEAIMNPALDFYEEHPALSFADCYLKCLAENREMLPVWTFDKKLVNQAKGTAKKVG